MRQPKLTHEKYTAPIVAKQNSISQKAYLEHTWKESICIFTEGKNTRNYDGKFIHLCRKCIITQNQKNVNTFDKNNKIRVTNYHSEVSDK